MITTMYSRVPQEGYYICVISTVRKWKMPLKPLKNFNQCYNSKWDDCSVLEADWWKIHIEPSDLRLCSFINRISAWSSFKQDPGGRSEGGWFLIINAATHQYRMKSGTHSSLFCLEKIVEVQTPEFLSLEKWFWDDKVHAVSLMCQQGATYLIITQNGCRQ